MDHYFDWYAMSEDRRIRFAKMKLIGHANLYWNNQERLRRNPITTWPEMKDALREKYLPESYQQRLLDQWQRLTQGNRSVTDYIAKFDEFLSRCQVREAEAVVLSRFRAGLREDLQRELILRGVNSLFLAYQMAQDIENFSRTSYKRYEPANKSNQPPRANPGQTPQTRPETYPCSYN